MRRRTSALPAVLALGLALATPAAAADDAEAAKDWADTRLRPGLHVSLTGAVGLDLEFGHSYSFAAASVLIPISSRGRAALFGGGTGVTFDLSRWPTARWTLDFFAFFVGGWEPRSCFIGPCAQVTDTVLIPGVGLGFRYLHRSGFTFAVKLPLFCVAGGHVGLLGPRGRRRRTGDGRVYEHRVHAAGALHRLHVLTDGGAARQCSPERTLSCLSRWYTPSTFAA